MENKPLLSIAIPTYERAVCLKSLLDCIVPQAEKFKGEIEICISNNGSTDNTGEIVKNFQKKYPDLIKYNENKENLGFDRNLLKVMEMSEGGFIWTFGDDDTIVENGINEVVKFLKEIPKENTGLIIVKREAYFIDKQTEKKIIYHNTLEKNQPEVFKIDKKDIIIPASFPDIAFISALIWNNKIVKKILKEDRATIEKGIGTANFHVLLFCLMFLKYPYIDAIALNKKIICSELPCYEFFVEDKFVCTYKRHKKLYRLLLSNKYMNDHYAPIFIKLDKGLRRMFIKDMIILKSFGFFNYFSYFGCLKLFFHCATFMDALLFSLIFSILFLIPSVILRFMYKVLLIIRHGKKWKHWWQLAININTSLHTNKGTRRESI